MFEKCTERAIKAIMLGQEESRESGHNYLGVEQLFLGLIRLGKGFAFQSLQKFDITLDKTRSELLKILPAGSDVTDPELLPFTDDANVFWNSPMVRLSPSAT